MARRTIAVSRDEQFGADLATHLTAAGLEVVLQRTVPPGEDAALWVIDADAEIALDAVPGTAPIIALVDGGGLGALVERMQASDRIAGALQRSAYDARQLQDLARRATGLDDALGVSGRLRPDTSVHRHTIGTTADKLVCMGEIYSFAMRTGLPDTQIESIAQCVDELVMNALYDAPVDARGHRLFEGVSVKRRVTMRTDREVAVEYAFDGTRFAVAVRDAFGRLERGTVLRHLYKGLHASDKVEHKAGGAGLGLYLMASTASTLAFTVRPGTLCEAVCLFERTVGAGATELEHVTLPPAASPNTARAMLTPEAQSARRHRIARTALAVALATAAVVTPPFPTSSHVDLAVAPSDARVTVDGRPLTPAQIRAGLSVPLARTRHVSVTSPGHAPVELALRGGVASRSLSVSLALVPTVELDSTPTDAAVTVDGTPMGSTPLTLTTLTPGAHVALAFDKPGYQHATAELTVPARGQRSQHVQALARAIDVVRVRVTSTPPGAEIVREGQSRPPDHTYTPADLYLEADRPARFTLSMRGYAPRTVDVLPRRGEDGVTADATLVREITAPE